MKRAPFTEEQVKDLNDHQNNPQVHPYTCCSYDGCDRSEKNKWGTLIATPDGWICPCGIYTQDWAH